MLASNPNDKNEHVEALHRRRALGTTTADTRDDISRLAAYIGTAPSATIFPIAALFLIGAERHWFKSIIGLDVREASCEDAFCAHTVFQHDLMGVSDAMQDLHFADSPHDTDDPKSTFVWPPSPSPRTGLPRTACVSLTEYPDSLLRNYPDCSLLSKRGPFT